MDVEIVNLKASPGTGLSSALPPTTAVIPAPSARRLRALDWLNLLLAEVRGGIGPYLAIDLMASRHWDAGHIGVAMAAMGMATVTAQTPAGALADSLDRKRLAVSERTPRPGIWTFIARRIRAWTR